MGKFDFKEGGLEVICFLYVYVGVFGKVVVALSMGQEIVGCGVGCWDLGKGKSCHGFYAFNTATCKSLFNPIMLGESRTFDAYKLQPVKS